METIDCLGVKIARIHFKDFQSWFQTQLNKPLGKPSLLFLANAHTLNLASHSQDFRDVLNQAALVLNDGVGLEIYSAIARKRFFYNFNGTDLLPRLFSTFDTSNSPLRVFLYGAQPARAEQAARVIEARYPGVRVVGCLDGFDNTVEYVLSAINGAQADLLLVAKGNPKQELWLSKHHNVLRVKVAVGVGALIDFLSGNITRAPQWVRTIKCEWVYRLFNEPRRLFVRYVIGNPKFLIRSVRYLMKHKRSAV